MPLILPQGALIIIDIDRVEFGMRGARGKPASAGYRIWEASGMKVGLRLNVSADVDPELAQNESAVRLRAARAGVQIAKRLAGAIQSGEVVAVCDTRNWGTHTNGSTYAWWEIAWLLTDQGEDGFDRRAKLHAERRTNSVDTKPKIDDALVKRAQTLAVNGLNYLHGAIGAAENKVAFYCD